MIWSVCCLLFSCTLCCIMYAHVSPTNIYSTFLKRMNMTLWHKNVTWKNCYNVQPGFTGESKETQFRRKFWKRFSLQFSMGKLFHIFCKTTDLCCLGHSSSSIIVICTNFLLSSIKIRSFSNVNSENNGASHGKLYIQKSNPEEKDCATQVVDASKTVISLTEYLRHIKVKNNPVCMLVLTHALCSYIICTNDIAPWIFYNAVIFSGWIN